MLELQPIRAKDFLEALLCLVDKTKAKLVYTVQLTVNQCTVQMYFWGGGLRQLDCSLLETLANEDVSAAHKLFIDTFIPDSLIASLKV